jgi:hypothetical protein
MFRILGFFLACFGIGCGACAVYNMFRAALNRKPGVPFFPSAFESPFNILFVPSDLTPAGLRYRRRTFACVLLCLGVAVLMLALGTLVRREPDSQQRRDPPSESR